MMNKNLQQTLKVGLISVLVSMNAIIWHEIFGVKFFIGVVLISLMILVIGEDENVCR
ncbi:MAG: hypothetical protein HZA27_00300 [Candidatus Omnitrophica bacterium]|nr:hypothetical protein [Candidatus Omnitrophota bacterium]